MKVILSQRIDYNSDYNDIPYVRYQYPKAYRNQLSPGTRFIYNQGNRYKKEHRYYYGFGVIGAIYRDNTDGNYVAEILDGVEFPNKVPIYMQAGEGYIENLGYESVRSAPKPPWQSAIRNLSNEAFDEILR